MKRLLVLLLLVPFVAVSAFAMLRPAPVLSDMVRSSSLQMIQTKEGNVERIDYLNPSGILTEAAELHYASLVRTVTDAGRLEEFFDANGHPAQQPAGNYAVLYSYNEAMQNDRITYLGLDGAPVMLTTGYATNCRVFNRENQVIAEAFLDAEGNPVETFQFCWGTRKSYDQDGRNSEITYVNAAGEPAENGMGYATLRRSFYPDGSIEKEFYYDAQGMPVALSLGQYGVWKQYDALGRAEWLIYLDANGQASPTRQGYTMVKRTFYADDSVESEHYYDKDRFPVSLSHGQYGVKYVNGQTIYLTQSQAESFSLGNYLYRHPMSVMLLAGIPILLSLKSEKRWNTALLVVYVAFIIYMTLLFRETTESRASFAFFSAFEQMMTNQRYRLEVFYNIWLFFPLGALLYRQFPNARVLMAAPLLSLGIETAQFLTGRGLFELGDLISNSLGGALGCGLGYLLLQLPGQRLNRRSQQGIENEMKTE